MKLFTVTELTQEIKKLLESPFSCLQVKGEVSNVRHQASGHFYFSLKDQGAQISAVIFRGNARNMSSLPKMGDQIIVRGGLSLYVLRGTYQIIVRSFEYAGVGALLLRFHELKEELKNLGWFDPGLKKPLPKYPKTIGVVTSSTGSVIQDIIHVLKRRFPRFHLILNPVRVQGDGAAEEISAAINLFNLYNLADILIVGRGGGSLEDLWSFNEYCVAKAIFQSKIPIISAIGHETDTTIADYVSDVRAPTPSAAAEISVRKLTSQIEFLTQIKMGIYQNIKQLIKHSRARLQGKTEHPLLTSPDFFLAHYIQKLEDLSKNLDGSIKQKTHQKQLSLIGLKRQLQSLKPSSQIAHTKTKLISYNRSFQEVLSHRIRLLRKTTTSLFTNLENVQKNIIANKKAYIFSRDLKRILLQTMCTLYEKKREKLNYLREHLKAINPKNILQKGYCIPFAENGRSVMISSHSLRKEMRLWLRFYDGNAMTRIEEVHRKNYENI